VTVNVLAVLLIAYLFGSVPVGVLVARTYNIDIQKVGSGNTGATNVLRVAGWGPGLAVMFADIMKAGLAVVVAQAFGLPHWLVALAALAAVLGHCYSVFLGFRGGKGVAASYGVVLFMDPGLALAIAPFFVGTILVTRYVSAGSIVSAMSAPILAIAMQRWDYRLGITFGLFVMVVFKHRQNLARMFEGTESRIDQRLLRPGPKEAPAAVVEDLVEAADEAELRAETGREAPAPAAPGPAAEARAADGTARRADGKPEA
jgi:glycerol-3-phosphate acyltransferase PlsY